MWKPFQRYRALDPEARKLFRRAVILLARTTLSLRTRGFKKTKDALQKKLPSIPPPQVPKDKAAELVGKTCRMVRAAAHYGIGQPTCLVESLTLWYLLQKQNVPANLRIGVRKSSERFEAHAWVEYDGDALNQAEEQHQHYAAFDSEFADLPGEKP
jgi:hypothetical protein